MLYYKLEIYINRFVVELGLCSIAVFGDDIGEIACCKLSSAFLECIFDLSLLVFRKLADCVLITVIVELYCLSLCTRNVASLPYSECTLTESIALPVLLRSLFEEVFKGEEEAELGCAIGDLMEQTC